MISDYDYGVMPMQIGKTERQRTELLKRMAEMENVMRLQTDVIADLNKHITELRAGNAVLTQEIESYRADEQLFKERAAAYKRLMSEMESESGEKR